MTRDPDDGTFLVHRLVQDVTRRGLAEAGSERQRLTEALGWVDAAFAGDPQDVRTWPCWNHWRRMRRRWRGTRTRQGIAEPTLYLMGRLDVLFDAKALYSRAEFFSRRALAIAEANWPPNDPTRRHPPQQPRRVAAKPPTGSARRNR